MLFSKSSLYLSVAFLCAVCAAAQDVPIAPSTLEMPGYDVRGSGLSANSPATLLNFTVEGDTAGDNMFHVITSDPGVIVSVILPSGAEITSLNAASQGFTHTVLPDSTGVDVDSIVALPGTHTLIQIPGGQVSGTYSIKANATTVNADSAIIASYYGSSNVHAAVTTDSYNYTVGGTVVLSGLVLKAGIPITGATVTAGVSTPRSLAGQTSVGNPQVVSEHILGPNLTEYQYSFTLTNTGSAVREVQAVLAATPQNIVVQNGELLFGDIVANSITTSLTTLVIQADPALDFDPSTLQWNVTATGDVTNVSLFDSGTFDAATGDGIYTGTFSPSTPGTYTTVLSITGTSLEGNSFSRTAIGFFDVTAQHLASLVGFSDVQQSNGVTTTASVNVVTPGTYRISMQLLANNQKTAWATATMDLASGTQQVALTFPNFALYALGVGGPYERVNATLLQIDASENSLMADFRADAGPTLPYTLSSFAPALYFTGSNSATGVAAGGTTFSALNVQIGIYSASGTCDWSAALATQTGVQIDLESGTLSGSPGANILSINFSGPAIASSGVDGPYLVNNVALNCGGSFLKAASLFQTQAFTASQFSAQSAVTVTTAANLLAAYRASTPVVVAPSATITSTGGGTVSNGKVTFTMLQERTIIGSSVTATVINGFASAMYTLPAATAPGSYTIQAVYNAVTGFNISSDSTHRLTIPGVVATPTFSPAAGTYTTSQTVTISTTTSGASIRYTTDGSTPSETVGTLYTGPITISSTTTIDAIAYAPAMTDSSVSTVTYTITVGISLRPLTTPLSANQDSAVHGHRKRMPQQPT